MQIVKGFFFCVCDSYSIGYKELKCKYLGEIKVTPEFGVSEKRIAGGFFK